MNIAPPPGSSDILDPAAAALLVSIKDQGFPGWAYLTIEQGRAMLLPCDHSRASRNRSHASRTF
jgi:hypothetical protein